MVSTLAYTITLIEVSLIFSVLALPTVKPALVPVVSVLRPRFEPALLLSPPLPSPLSSSFSEGSRVRPPDRLEALLKLSTESQILTNS